MSNMHSYVVESLAPLVFRAGKPFGSQASAQDVVFPLPSTGAGLIRALAIIQGHIDFSEQRIKAISDDASYQQVLNIASQGVFLLRLHGDNKADVLVAKPANALYLADEESSSDKHSDSGVHSNLKLIRLAPKAYLEDCGSDLPTGLLPVQITQALMKGKPKSGASFWTLAHVLAWQEGKDLTYAEVSSHGLSQLPIELRTHVAIDSKTQAGEDSKLFQTASFDLAHQAMGKSSSKLSERGWQSHRYGFMILSKQKLSADLATLGGERRLSHFYAIDNPTPKQNANQLLTNINNQGGFSLTLLTPAIFAKGYLPRWLQEQDGKIVGTLPSSQTKVILKAVANEHWQAVSGWDSQLWKPKATRKAVPAGSVYWLELAVGSDMDSQGLAFLQQPLSDDGQDKNDGFGVALIAPWAC